MRTKFLIPLIFLGLRLFSQSPTLINYQGIVRDDKGQPVVNQAIALRFEILVGSASGTVVYTDDQLSGISTNGFGLFSTQIGKNGGLAGFNWQQNQTYYLQVSVDPTGGSNLVALGNAQQLASVPFALHAESVPATYSNNLLSIGNKTFNITPSITATPNTSLTVSGIGIVTPAGTNTFDINIPAPTFSNTGQTIITGTYPNYSVNTPTVPAAVTPSISITTTTAANATVASSGSSFSINVPPPTFSNTGQTLVTGTYPNYSVNTPTVPGTSIALTATAAAGPSVSTIGTNSFNINIPATPNTSIALTATAAAGPSISAVGTNSFNLNIPPSTDWSTLGNVGTSSVSNFIGTTDNTDLKFRINNTRSGSIEFSGSTYLGYLTGPLAPAAGANVGIGSNDLSSVSTGVRNVAIGYNNLNNLTTGSRNVGIGGAALLSIISGDDNLAFGYQALRQLTAGSSNVAVGPSSLGNAQGSSNVAVGYGALGSNLAGNFNVAIGMQSGNANLGSSNVFLGYRAGYNELGSNKLYIANNSTIAPLIYGDFLNNRLAIGTTTANGDLQFSNIISGRKIILWEGANNDHQVYAIGTNVNAMRYQVDASVANHIFYSGINSTSSQELMRIQGNQRVGINTPAPTATFEVTGTTKLVDGSQGAGKVLTSDALGNATWQSLTAATTPSMYAAGIASVNPATGYNFTVTVNQPTFAYSQTNGSLTSGTSSAFITPTLNFTGTTLSSGPASNSVNLSALSPWVATGGSVALTTSTNFVGIGTSTPSYKLDILGTSGPRMRVFSQDGLFAGLLAKNNTHEYFVGIQADYESAGGVTSGFHIFDNTAGARRMVIDATGRVGIANSAPQHQVNIGDVTSDSQLFSLRVYQQTTSNASGWMGTAAFGGTTTAVVAGEVNTFATIGGHSSNLSTWTDLLINPGAGNVGIGLLTAPHALLHFSNSIANRKIILWEGSNNDHQFYGFGINGATLRYQTDSPGADHVFYAGTSATTSDELFRIKGTGLVKMGNETGTSQGPSYPSGGGMMFRRIYTNNVAASQVVAKTDQMTLERDGTYGGWVINRTGVSGVTTCNCMGVNSVGVSVNRVFNNMASGVTQVFTNGDNIVFFHCMFGDPYSSGHLTEVSLTRQHTDWFWVGTVTSTFNQ